jgi:hypothetical protein
MKEQQAAHTDKIKVYLLRELLE